MRKLALATCAVLLSFGCAHKPVETKTAEAPPPVATPPPPPAAAPAPNTCENDLQCKDGQLCIRSACVDISLGLAECQMFRVHFAFNAYDVGEESKADLTRMSRCLRADQKMQVIIEGNADERGTEEYNLQLGSKRASAVEKYLVALGVSPAQVKTVSYGTNNPVCTEHDEACWAKNRRAAVKPPGAVEGKETAPKAKKGKK